MNPLNCYWDYAKGTWFLIGYARPDPGVFESWVITIEVRK